MKDNLGYLRKNFCWFMCLLVLNMIFILLLWLADITAFRVLVTAILFGEIIFFMAAAWFIIRRERKKEEAFLAFLRNPDKGNEEKVLQRYSHQEGILIKAIARALSRATDREQALKMQINDYEEYVEAWAHEIKTPIALLTLMLGNHREKLPENVVIKLDYIQNQLQEYVNQILYYARIKCNQKDYILAPVDLSQCCMAAVENYLPLLEEKGFHIQQEVQPFLVIAEERSLEFIISQIISNAVKYCSLYQSPKLTLRTEKKDQQILLHIEDNGIGIQPWDLPFIFEKGFTGDNQDTRKKATGMGLYLAKEIAEAMKIQLEPHSKGRTGFTMILKFPLVDTEIGERYCER